MKSPKAETVERLLRQQESLHQVVEAISSELELRPLLTTIVRRACDLLEADAGSIGLYDAERGVVRTEAVHHMPAGELGAEMPPGVGLAGQVLLRREPVLCERYDMLPHPTQPALGADAVLGMPILWRGELTGVFGLGARPPRRFTPEDVRTLGLLARHTAIAIENARLYAREQRRSERLALIGRVGRIITSGLDLDELLQRAADAIHELLGYPNVDVPLIDPQDPGTLVVRVRGGRYKQLIAHEDRLSIATGIMGAAARERRPQLVNDVSADARYVRPPAGVEVRAELAVPILHVNQALGVLNVESQEPFAPEDATSLQIVADHLAVAIRNARLFQSAQGMAALEERQRLARDLHDSVAQILFSVTLVAQSLGPAWRRDPQEGKRQVQRLLDLTRTALAEMRALLAELRPAEPVPELAHAESTLSSLSRIRREGLAQSLRTHLAESVPAETRCELHAGRYRPQPLEIEEVLYRIAAEAVHNAVKHARASLLDVTLSVVGARARLRVQDDGRGFDLQQAARRRQGDLRGSGLGLLSMRERAESIGGRLRLRTRAARGTTIDVVLPVPAAAALGATGRAPARRERA